MDYQYLESMGEKEEDLDHTKILSTETSGLNRRSESFDFGDDDLMHTKQMNIAKIPRMMTNRVTINMNPGYANSNSGENKSRVSVNMGDLESNSSPELGSKRGNDVNSNQGVLSGQQQ